MTGIGRLRLAPALALLAALAAPATAEEAKVYFAPQASFQQALVKELLRVVERYATV